MLLFVFALLLVAACAGARRPRDSEGERPRAGVCPDLAYTFRLVAENRDRGAAKATQRKLARESLRESAFVTDYERSLADWYRVITMVYEAPSLSPSEIEEAVLLHCVVDEQGRAVVRDPWSGAGALE